MNALLTKYMFLLFFKGASGYYRLTHYLLMDKSSWKLGILQVLLLATATHAWRSGADHYWPLNEIAYGRVYDISYRPYHERWHGNIKGNAEITWSPPQVAFDLYGQDSWVDLGSRYNSCYVDVKYCNQSGITVAFWVSFREANTTQGLIEFGSGDCGLILARTSDNEINATIRSMELGNTWSLQSVNASIRHGMWHHLALTWNATGEFHLFINGTRFNNVSREGISNVSCADTNCACDWSMKVGTMTRYHSPVQPYSSVELARLILWHYALSNETILGLSKDVQGLFFSNKGCSSGWIASLQFCYHIQSSWKQTWHESKKYCDEKLANLVSIGSQEEYDVLEEVLHKKQESTCLHIGLQTKDASSIPSWIDGNLWSFQKLNMTYDQENTTDLCAYRDVDGLWYLTSCSKKCGFICKKYRGGMFRNAEFHCRVRRHNRQLIGHRLAIRWVKNELACAIDCLIYGSGCQSYNYKHNHDLASNGQNICELNSSNQHKHPASLLSSIGFQYCERVS
ncbi:uncharacterized protein LOC144639072 isoform X1 [Oculina patagonica]